VLRTDGGTNFTPVSTGSKNEVGAYLDSGTRIAFFVQGGFKSLGFDYSSNQPVSVSVYDQSWRLVSAGSSLLEAVAQNCNPSVHFSCWTSASFGFSSTAYYGVLEGTTQELLIDNLLLEVDGTSAPRLIADFASAPWSSGSSLPGAGPSGVQTGPGAETPAPGTTARTQLPPSNDVPLPGALPLVGLGLAMLGRVRIRNRNGH
jgi:hypothetical protein